MYHFIINPNSRSGKGAAIWTELRAILDNRKIPYRAYLTAYRGHAAFLAAEITKKASPDHPLYLVAVGGDGTVQEVLTGVRNLSCICFGYIPTGSGNDFCRGMKLPQDSKTALELILGRHRICPMDVPVITLANHKSRFAISCGIGFDAAVCHEVGVTPIKKALNRIKLGKLVYLFVALKQLLFLTPSPMSLILDEERRHDFQKVYFIAVMNQKYEGGGFKFCPDANSSDGVLDVIVVDGLRKLKVLTCLPTAFFGKHTRFKGIHIYRAKDVRVHSRDALAIHTDGEAAGVLKDFSAQLSGNPVHIILPENP